MTRRILPEQPKNLAEELMEDFRFHQRRDDMSEYNKIKEQCKKAAKEGKMCLELSGYLGLKELFEEEGLTVQEWVNMSKCDCDYTQSCGSHPQELTVLAWGKLVSKDGFYYIKGNKFTKKTE